MKARLTTGVVDNTTSDKSKAGRAATQLPEVGGQTYHEPLNPVNMTGWHWPPEPGDTVEAIIPAFGDMAEFPDEVYYLGVVKDKWNAADKEFHENYPKRRGFKTVAGSALLVDDKDKTITLKTASGHKLFIDEKNGKIKIEHGGGTLISITSAGIFLGGDAAAQPMVLGALWQTLMSQFMAAYMAHTHVVSGGNTLVPTDLATPPLQTSVASGNQLSTLIKGQ